MTDGTDELREFASQLFARAKAQGQPAPPVDSVDDDPNPTRAFLRALFQEQ